MQSLNSQPPFHFSFSSLGLCLEKVPPGSPSLTNKTPDRDQDIITYYEKSGDIALLYLQEVEKVRMGPDSCQVMLFLSLGVMSSWSAVSMETALDGTHCTGKLRNTERVAINVTKKGQGPHS